MEHRLFGTGHLVAVVSTGLPFGVGQGKWLTGWVVPGTLLGPEGSGVFCPALQCGPFLLVVPPWFLGFGLGVVVGAGVWFRFRPYFENYTVDASIFVNQVFKGARWMPWHQEPKKDVGICDKPRGVDNQTVIRGFPNGETRLEASPVTPT